MEKKRTEHLDEKDSSLREGGCGSGNWQMQVDYPDEEEREMHIAQIVALGMCRPQRLSSALCSLWAAVGIRGIFFGVWDCMLLALLLDGLLWAAVYETAAFGTDMPWVLAFLASPVLYALLHLLTIWKEQMAGMYQTLMVCRLSLRQMTVLRLLFACGISVLLFSGFHVWAVCGAWEGMSVYRLLGLSVSALFFYAWMQLLLEWRWRHRISYLAAPAIWSCLGLVLLLGGWDLRSLQGIPTATLFLCAGVCMGMYLAALKQYYFEPCTV